MNRFLNWIMPLGLLVGPHAFAAEATREANINVRLTDEGRKLAPPTRAHPVFYTPVIAGYSSAGPNQGDTPPPPKTIVNAWIFALAKQGYLISIPDKTPPASLILIFKWGVINREIEDSADGPILRNQAALLKLLGNPDADFLWASVENDWLMSELQSDRCFATVAAYDYGAAVQQKKKLLWIARMSAPSEVISLDALLPKLIEAGAAYVGHETKKPQRIDVSVVPPGKVRVGTPTVVPPPPKK